MKRKRATRRKWRARRDPLRLTTTQRLVLQKLVEAYRASYKGQSPWLSPPGEQEKRAADTLVHESLATRGIHHGKPAWRLTESGARILRVAPPARPSKWENLKEEVSSEFESRPISERFETVLASKYQSSAFGPASSIDEARELARYRQAVAVTSAELARRKPTRGARLERIRTEHLRRSSERQARLERIESRIREIPPERKPTTFELTQRQIRRRGGRSGHPALRPEEKIPQATYETMRCTPLAELARRTDDPTLRRELETLFSRAPSQFRDILHAVFIQKTPIRTMIADAVRSHQTPLSPEETRRLQSRVYTAVHRARLWAEKELNPAGQCSICRTEAAAGKSLCVKHLQVARVRSARARARKA